MNKLYYLVELYKKNVGKKASTILDIGSRDGDDAKYLAEALHADNVYTFEANYSCHFLIRDRYPEFTNIYGAVSDYKGKAMFNRVVSNDWEAVGTSSLKDRNDAWYDDKAEKVEVPVNTMKNLIVKHSIPLPMDLVKIDTEGCSFEVLTGFEENIKDVKMFHVENETYAYWNDQKLADEVSELLLIHGFTMIDERYFGTYSVDQVWIRSDII